MTCPLSELMGGDVTLLSKILLFFLSLVPLRAGAGLSAVERVLTRWSSGRGESNLRTRTKSPLPQISHLSVKSHSGIAPGPSFQPRVGSESGRTLGWCACTVAPLLRHCCGGDVCWRPAISLPAQSNVVGEVGRCEGVRWREVGVGVLRTGPVAAGVRVYISVGHL